MAETSHKIHRHNKIGSKVGKTKRQVIIASLSSQTTWAASVSLYDIMIVVTSTQSHPVLCHRCPNIPCISLKRNNASSVSEEVWWTGHTVHATYWMERKARTMFEKVCNWVQRLLCTSIPASKLQLHCVVKAALAHRMQMHAVTNVQTTCCFSRTFRSWSLPSSKASSSHKHTSKSKAYQ